MSRNTLFPVFLNLTGRPVVVIGGGRVALRKTRSLVRAGAVVTVVAPRFARGFEKLPVGRVDEPYRTAHLRGAAIVFAATDDRAANSAVAHACHARNILVNIADDPSGSGFHVPAAVRRGTVAVAVSTNGASPAFAARIRREIARTLANGWADLAGEAGRARVALKRSGLGSTERRRILRALRDALKAAR